MNSIWNLQLTSEGAPLEPRAHKFTVKEVQYIPDKNEIKIVFQITDVPKTRLVYSWITVSQSTAGIFWSLCKSVGLEGNITLKDVLTIEGREGMGVTYNICKQDGKVFPRMKSFIIDWRDSEAVTCCGEQERVIDTQ